MFYGERGVRKALGVIAVSSLTLAGCTPVDPVIKRPRIEIPVTPAVLSIPDNGFSERLRKGRLLAAMDFSGVKGKPFQGTAIFENFLFNRESGLTVGLDPAALQALVGACGNNGRKPGFHITVGFGELPYTVNRTGDVYVVNIGLNGIEDLIEKTKKREYTIEPGFEVKARENLLHLTMNEALATSICFGLLNQGQQDPRRVIEEADRRAKQIVEAMLQGKLSPVISVSDDRKRPLPTPLSARPPLG